MWLTLICLVRLNSKFNKSLKGNAVKIDHSIIESLKKRDPPQNISTTDFFQCPTFENSFNNIIFFEKNAMLLKCLK